MLCASMHVLYVIAVGKSGVGGCLYLEGDNSTCVVASGVDWRSVTGMESVSSMAGSSRRPQWSMC